MAVKIARYSLQQVVKLFNVLESDVESIGDTGNDSDCIVVRDNRSNKGLNYLAKAFLHKHMLEVQVVLLRADVICVLEQ
jgi:hypothetical protein